MGKDINNETTGGNDINNESSAPPTTGVNDEVLTVETREDENDATAPAAAESAESDSTGVVLGRDPGATNATTLFVRADGLPEGYRVVSETRAVPTYYRLGYVLESIAKNLREISGRSRPDLSFIYHPIPDAPLSLPLPNEIGLQQQLPITPLSNFEQVEGRRAGVSTVTASAELISGAQELVEQGGDFFQDAAYRNEYIYTTFDAPINIGAFDAFINRNPQMNAIKLIQSVIGMASKVLAGGGDDTVGFKLDSRVSAGATNIVEVFCSSKIEQGIEDEIVSLVTQGQQEEAARKAIAITYRKNNSLVESIDVSSKIDANAWAAFRQSGFAGRVGFDLVDVLFDDETGNFSRNLLPDYMQTLITPANFTTEGEGKDATMVLRTDTNAWEDFLANEELQQLTGNSSTLESVQRIAVSIRKYLNARSSGGEDEQSSAQREANRYLGQLIYIDPLFYNNLLSQFMRTENNVFMGKVLSNYLLTVVATVHGLVGLSPLDFIYVDNVVEGVRGIYYISDLEESISPGNFNTLMTMKLSRNF